MFRNRSVVLLSCALAVLGAVSACAESSPSEEDSGGSSTGGASTGGEGSSTGGAVASGGQTMTGGAVASGGSSPAGGMGGMGGTGGSGGLVQIPDCVEDSECDGANECQTAVCKAGSCTYPASGECECELDSDCDDADVCTTNTCVDRKCVAENNTNPCADDDNECTQDVCADGTCLHESLDETSCDDGDGCTDESCIVGVCTPLDNGLCVTTQVVMRSMRWGNSDQWLTFSGEGNLQWLAATTEAGAEVFDQESLGDGTFLLKSLSTGLYLQLNGNALAATGALEDADTFQTSDCGFGGVGIETVSDAVEGRFWKAEDPLIQSVNFAACDASNGSAWERFEILEVEMGTGGAGGMSSVP